MSGAGSSVASFRKQPFCDVSACPALNKKNWHRPSLWQAARQSAAAVAMSAELLVSAVHAEVGRGMTSYGAGTTNSSRQSLLLAAPSVLVWPGAHGVHASSDPPGEKEPGGQMAHWLAWASKPHPGAHTLHCEAA